METPKPAFCFSQSNFLELRELITVTGAITPKLLTKAAKRPKITEASLMLLDRLARPITEARAGAMIALELRQRATGSDAAPMPPETQAEKSGDCGLLSPRMLP
jgi:hypothetical protein